MTTPKVTVELPYLTNDEILVLYYELEKNRQLDVNVPCDRTGSVEKKIDIKLKHWHEKETPGQPCYGY